MNAIERFEEDLQGSGVAVDEVKTLGLAYLRSIVRGSRADWVELYVGVFAAVSRGVRESAAVDPEAVERMLLLLDDDLGSQLFALEARSDLAHRARACASMVTANDRASVI